MPTKSFYRVGPDTGWSSLANSIGFTYGGNSKDTLPGYTYYYQFSHVDIPKGSTVTSATIGITFSQKNAAAANTVVYGLYLENPVPRGPFVAGETPEDGVSRLYTNLGFQTINWNTAGISPQTFTHNVTTGVNNVVNNAAWIQGMPLDFAIGVQSQTGSSFVELTGYVWTLTITWTPPASDGTTVISNMGANPTMDLANIGATPSEIVNWGHNTGFGAYSTPLITRQPVSAAPVNPSSILGITVPYVARIELPTDNNVFVCPLPTGLEDAWYTISAYFYVPTGVPGLHWVDLFKSGGTWMHTKNAWTKVGMSFLASSQDTSFIGWDTSGVPSSTGQYIWMTGYSLTKTDYEVPFFNGDTPDRTGVTYDWHTQNKGGTSSVKFKKPNAPTTGTVLDQSVDHKGDAVTWTHSDPNTDPQTKYRIQYRKIS